MLLGSGVCLWGGGGGSRRPRPVIWGTPTRLQGTEAGSLWGPGGVAFKALELLTEVESYYPCNESSEFIKNTET